MRKIRKREDTRREFIGKWISVGCAAIGGMMVSTGCNNKQGAEEQSNDLSGVDHCGDLSGISESDIAVREKLGYVDETPIPDNQCENCNLYLPRKEGENCGGCMLFKGPVFSNAYCTYWAPRL